MRMIELEVDDDRVVVTKRFTGRRLVQWRHRDGARVRTFRVFATARDQFAVYEREEPDWLGMAAAEGEIDRPDRADTDAWNGEWWSERRRTLDVFATVDAMTGRLPDDLISLVRAASDRPSVEDLDI